MNDRRDELQTNELLVYLQKFNKSIEPYSKLIAVVVGVVIVGAIGLGLYKSKVAGDRSDATLQLLQAVNSGSAERLSTVSSGYPDTSAAAWARLYEGNTHLLDGLRAMYMDRAEAEERLADAKAAFESALSNSDDRLLRSRAHFGIARVAETMGDLDEAISAYKSCAEANESEAMVRKANERIEALSNAGTKDFINWFAEQDFKAPDPSLPPTLPGGGDLPDLPDLDLPPLDLGDDSDDEEMEDEKPKEPKDGGLELPNEADVSKEGEAAKDAGEAKSSDEAKGSDKPKSGDESAAEDDAAKDTAAKDKAATEKPEDKKPADDQPAEDAKSADADEPAEEKAAQEKE